MKQEKLLQIKKLLDEHDDSLEKIDLLVNAMIKCNDICKELIMQCPNDNLCYKFINKLFEAIDIAKNSGWERLKQIKSESLQIKTEINQIETETNQVELSECKTLDEYLQKVIGKSVEELQEAKEQEN